jgi:hypothetical protein
MQPQSTRLIPLTRGLFATVDASDYPMLNAHSWCAAHRRNTYYAVRFLGTGPARITILMHRAILELAPGRVPEVDHIDGDGLNNVRTNLRVATHAQNIHNARRRSDNVSGYRGVSRDSFNRKWRAAIMLDGKLYQLGRFAEIDDAARAYDAAARRLHGEFARLNFP